MKKIGILVGHFGPCTGAENEGRDEWRMALQDAVRLSKMIQNDGLASPVLIYIDKNEHPWDLIQQVSKVSPPSFLGGWGNIDLRVAWALREQVDVAVELHINSANGRPEGHEIFVRRAPGPKTRRLGQMLINSLDEFLPDHTSRGLKLKSYRVLRKLHAADIPAAIVEPAFITEKCLGLQEWREKYVRAVAMALYRFFNVREE